MTPRKSTSTFHQRPAHSAKNLTARDCPSNSSSDLRKQIHRFVNMDSSNAEATPARDIVAHAQAMFNIVAYNINASLQYSAAAVEVIDKFISGVSTT